MIYFQIISKQLLICIFTKIFISKHTESLRGFEKFQLFFLKLEDIYV